MNHFTANRSPSPGAGMAGLHGTAALSGDVYHSASTALLALHEHLLGSEHLDALLQQFYCWVREQGLAIGLRLLRPAHNSTAGAPSVYTEQVVGGGCTLQSVFDLEPPTAAHAPEHHARSAGLQLQLQHQRMPDTAQQQLLQQAVQCLQRHLQLVHRVQRLQAMALHDPLTGLLNRKALDERLQRELARAHRHQSALSLMVIDVDHFKQINDRHGHLGGDRILCTLAALFRSTVRDVDLVFRHGGDEFVILLPETALTQAHCLAQRLRDAVAAQSWPVAPMDTPVHGGALGENGGEIGGERGGESGAKNRTEAANTGNSMTERPDISIGVAQYHCGDSASDLLHRADRQLYAVKHNGRGGVCAA